MRIPLSIRVGFIVVILVLTGGALTAYLVYSSTSSALEKSVSTNQLEITRQMLDKIDRFLDERKTDVRTFANRQEVKEAALKPSPALKASLQTNLAQLKQIAGNWNELALYDTHEMPVASSETTTQIPQPEVSAALKRALAGEDSYTDFFVSRETGEPLMVFFSPVRADIPGKEIVGALEGELAWPVVSEILESNSDSDPRLLNKQGQVIADNFSAGEKSSVGGDFSSTPLYAETQKRLFGTGIFPDPGNPKQASVTSYAKETGYLDFGGNDWELILETPRSAAFISATQLATTLMWVFGIILALSVLVLLLVLNHEVIHPIVRLKEAVDRVASGDFSEEVRISSHDELGELGQGFNKMTHQLAELYSQLQKTSDEAQWERARLLSSINGLKQGFIITDVDLRIITVNNAARQMLRGLALGEGISLSQIETYFTGNQHLEESARRVLQERKILELEAIHHEGRILQGFLSPVTAIDDQVIGCAILLADVTEEYILQRSRDEFFSIASHELRTPLTAIRGNTSMIQEYFADVLKNPDLKDMVTDIHDSAVRLIEIVSDFLDVSRLEQGRMPFKPEPFRIEELMEKVVYELGSLSKEKKIYLRLDKAITGLPNAYADPSRIKQVIYNLIGNAMKFTEKGGITISGRAERGQLKILIQDTGLGIDVDGQQLLFHKFQQATSSIITRDTTRGTGLGLYISKLIVEKSGGKVALEQSEVGKGSTFSFTLPTTPAAAAPEAITAAAGVTHAAPTPAPAAASTEPITHAPAVSSVKVPIAKPSAPTVIPITPSIVTPPPTL